MKERIGCGLGIGGYTSRVYEEEDDGNVLWYKNNFIKNLWWRGKIGCFSVELNGKEYLFDTVDEAKRFIDDYQ